jgi:geranylgeranyl diphosphate synthase type I
MTITDQPLTGGPSAAIATAAAVPVEAVERRIDEVLAGEATRWSAVDPSLGALPELLASYVSRGGKRLRPSFVLAGVVAGGGDPTSRAAVDLAAATELLHAFALIHDDVMDGSATRRGEPAMHVALEDVHRRSSGRGESRRFGEGLAVLAGDLALVYADRLVPPLTEVRAVWDELRVELTMGQFLDVHGAGLGSGTPERSRRIAMLKSGRYTIVRPLHLAAALTDRPDLEAPFARFGEPLGRAFQLRDDVLGAFGSPAATGKPAGDDLREAKPTLLLELARAAADPAQSAVLDRVGRPDLDDDDVDSLRAVLTETGALAAVEAEIERDAAAAEAALALAPVTPAGRALLDHLRRIVVDRDR